MAARRNGILALFLCLCLCLCWTPGTVQAASTSDAKEPISTETECTLAVAYRYDATPFSGCPVALYHIAEISADFQYTLTSDFESSGLILNGIKSNGEWNVVRSTLEVYILANHVAPVASAVTDDQGQACFDELKPGLYLTSAVTVTEGEQTCVFDAALVSLPGLNTDGLWEYDVAVAAKPEILPPIQPDEEIQLKVLKLWKGDEGRQDRPAQVEVELYRDGVVVETVLLSEENHWSYSWTVKEDGANWQVVERNVPDGYTMTVEQRETTFVLTNTWIPDDPGTPTPPPTGDTANVLLNTVLLYVSGTMLLILGIAGKRKHHENTK